VSGSGAETARSRCRSEAPALVGAPATRLLSLNECHALRAARGASALVAGLTDKQLVQRPMPLLTPDGLQRLQTARAAMDEGVYDEVLYEVADRVQRSGSIGKVDIGALLFWKRLQANTPWAARLHFLPDLQVRATTAIAVEAVRDPAVAVPEATRRGRSALTALPGFSEGDALASAVLLAAAPLRMAVYDRRAEAALTLLGIELSAAAGRYGRYMGLVESLRDELSASDGGAWAARDVDLAPFAVGR